MQKENIILVHPLHVEGIAVEIQPLLDREFPNSEIVEVKPLVGSVKKSADWPFAKLAAQQEQIFEEVIQPLLSHNPAARITYFGVAPIPLIVHLGQLVQMQGRPTARNRTWESQTWDWQGRGNDEASFELDVKGVPSSIVDEKGDVVVIIETSAKVVREDVDKIVPHRIAYIEISSKQIEKDELKQEIEMFEVAEAFRRVLESVSSQCPSSAKVHLFAGVPAGLAFMLGTKIHPSSHPKVVTYKFTDREPIRHLKALTLPVNYPEPERLLFVGANPDGTDPIEWEQEFLRMEDVIRAAWPAASMELKVLKNPTPAILGKAIRDFRPTILHYSGHADPEQLSFVQERDLSTKPRNHKIVNRSGVQLGRLLGTLVPPPKLVVLNACHSAFMKDPLLVHVSCVIGMNRAVADSSAILFAQDFYDALATGNSIYASFEHGKWAMGEAGDIPELFVRKSGDEGIRLFFE